MKNKKSLGQFFTTNVNYILSGFESYVRGKQITDPFAGQGDLIKWADLQGADKTSGFDFDSNLAKSQKFIHNDSFINFPKAKFILTNPPYLAKNKMSKVQKEKYLDNKCDDFYLLAIKKIIDTNCPEGIIIIPVNFFSAENSDEIRKDFLSKYKITKINYFKEQVFDDTTYNVVAFHFIKTNSLNKEAELNFTFFPDENKKTFKVFDKFAFKVGGNKLNEIISSPSTLKITRLTEWMIENSPGEYKIDCLYNDLDTNETYYVNKSTYNTITNNIILLNCIDSKGDNKKICAEDVRNYGVNGLVGKISSRNIASIIIENLSINQQEKLIHYFNDVLFILRTESKSMILTNFRDNDRKRISFEFCYKILNYCYNNLILDQNPKEKLSKILHKKSKSKK